MIDQGLLVTFEGGDGAGKSTLINGLYQFLRGRGENVIQTRAPGGTDLGNKIRSLLLHHSSPMNFRCELFLFLADRAQQYEEIIHPALQLGQIVLCDRFHDSTIAYQGSRGLDHNFLTSLCLFASQGKNPDLTFYLDLPPEVGLKRTLHKTGEKDRIESETLSFHEEIRSAFLRIAQQEPSRVRVLDATKSPEQILQQAIDQFNDIFFSHRQ